MCQLLSLIYVYWKTISRDLTAFHPNHWYKTLPSSPNKMKCGTHFVIYSRGVSQHVLRHTESCHLGTYLIKSALRWRHNERDCVSNHQPRHCLLNRLFRRRSKKTSKLRVTGLCAGNSPGTGEFPAQMASSAENVSIWWRHHGMIS